MERITNVTPENISDRIERERKTWSGYSFSEEHLPKDKDEVKEEETQIPTPPPTPPAKKQEVKEEKKVKKVTDEAKKGKFGPVG